MNISLVDFIRNNNIAEEFLKNKINCFVDKEYSYLFFSVFLKKIKLSFHDINYLNINNLELHEIKNYLEQSFLGNNLCYWLGNISDYKEKKELLLYLNNYSGNHYIGFFVDIENLEAIYKNVIIKCEIIAKDNYSPFLILWPTEKYNIINQFIKKIFDKKNSISLDQFCIFVNYALLLGNRYSNFIDEWLEKILLDDHSLFTLSKYFFAFDAHAFYKYWNLISNNYMPIFWTIYWSEQLYKAYNFIYLREQNKNLQAKQIAYKLPFSFIQSDWKKTSLNELMNAHQSIYNIDYVVKNGGSDLSLEVFYAQFLARKFNVKLS